MRIFLILLAMCLPLMSNAQSNDTSINEAAIAERPEGMIVHNTCHERHVLDLEEYSYGKTGMDRKAYAEFLKNNCAPAFTKYHKGQQMIASGWSLFGLGLATTTIGSCLFLSEAFAGVTTSAIFFRNDPEKAKQVRLDFERSGIVLTSIGVGMTISSVVLLPIGYKYRKQSVDIFNNQCSLQRQSVATLNLQSSSDGIGLAISF